MSITHLFLLVLCVSVCMCERKREGRMERGGERDFYWLSVLTVIIYTQCKIKPVSVVHEGLFNFC